ncbi:hypothetical protein [Enterovirga aerilata]|uniref:DUF4893 domain-containing protein n=1 Tax=Enterovirga aerilata TaxID=2730920 RepID=A0A849II97_9HYPH|nr:hypothetical protein [Enterovirga sp. DB1703]NNM73663.1 hypothetical protein [Enterovirga sp. DB1703]
MRTAPSLRAIIPATCLLLAGPAFGQSLAEMRERSATIAERYLAVWSSSGDLSIEGVPYVYGPRVTFYGRSLDWRGLAAEKRRAVRRWPVRSYRHRPGSMQVICNGETRRCAVRSIIDYRVANPTTGRRASGAASFDLGISFAGPRPVILYETGRPLRRGN